MTGELASSAYAITVALKNSWQAWSLAQDLLDL